MKMYILSTDGIPCKSNDELVWGKCLARWASGKQRGIIDNVCKPPVINIIPCKSDGENV